MTAPKFTTLPINERLAERADAWVAQYRDKFNLYYRINPLHRDPGHGDELRCAGEHGGADPGPRRRDARGDELGGDVGFRDEFGDRCVGYEG